MDRKKFLFLLFFLIILGSGRIMAQDLVVTGKVTDSEGIEIIGAGVTLKGVTGVGATSDINGKYSINVSNPDNAVLIFSYLGMKNQEISVKGRKVINVTMQADALMLRLCYC